MFPQPYIELQRELATGLHVELEQILAGVAADELDMKLSHIAAYCGIILNDVYTLEDRIRLCELLLPKLIERRKGATGILVLN